MRPTVQRWWPVLLGLGMCLVFIPAWYGTATLFRVSAIAAPSPILVIQDHGRVGLVNTGDATTAALTVVPFLQKQGINQIDWALAVNAAEGWSAIASQISIKALYDLSDPQQPALDPAAMPNYTRLKPADRLQIGGLSVRFISQDPTLIQLDIGQARWLWLKDIPNKKERGTLGDLQNYQVLWWSGRRLHPQFLEGLKPSSAIAYSNVDRETLAQLQRSQVSVYSTAQEGALTWTPQQGFELALDRAD
jgi:competence protein ComEC